MKLTSVPFSFRAVILLISNVPRTSCFFILFKLIQSFDQIKFLKKSSHDAVKTVLILAQKGKMAFVSPFAGQILPRELKQKVVLSANYLTIVTLKVLVILTLYIFVVYLWKLIYFTVPALNSLVIQAVTWALDKINMVSKLMSIPMHVSQLRSKACFSKVSPPSSGFWCYSAIRNLPDMNFYHSTKHYISIKP